MKKTHSHNFEYKASMPLMSFGIKSVSGSTNEPMEVWMPKWAQL